MQPIFSKIDIERLCNQIQAKRNQFVAALKADKEFAEIKPIYKELRQLISILQAQNQSFPGASLR